MSYYIWTHNGKKTKETADISGSVILKQYLPNGKYLLYKYNGLLLTEHEYSDKKIKTFINPDYKETIYNGSLNFENLKIEFPKTIKKITGYLCVTNSKMSSLESLEYIGGSLYIKNTPNLKNINNLKYVGGKIFYDKNSSIEKQLKTLGLV